MNKITEELHPNIKWLLDLFNKYRHGTFVITVQEGIPSTVEEMKTGRLIIGKMVELESRKKASGE
jgi:hypothetical protein